MLSHVSKSGPSAYWVSTLAGEVWLGVSYAALVELVPSKQKTTIVALFVFVVENVAGLGPVFVTFIQSAFYGYGYTSPQALKCTYSTPAI